MKITIYNKVNLWKTDTADSSKVSIFIDVLTLDI